LHGIFRSASLITRFEWLFSDHYGREREEGHCPNTPSYGKKLKKIVEFICKFSVYKNGLRVIMEVAQG